MRSSSASPLAPHQRGFAIAATSALLLAVMAAPALAQDAADGQGDADTEVSVDPDGDASTDDGDLVDAAATAEACTPELVTHTPDGSSGTEEAVAITSQAVDRGVDGWIGVSWQIADGAALTGLTVTAVDGTVSTYTADIESGFREDVASLRFCGSYDGEVSVQPEPPVEHDEGTHDDTTSGGDDEATDDSPTGGGTDDSTGGSGGDDGSGSAGGSGDDGGSGSSGTDDGDDPEVVTVPTPDEELDLGDEATVESAETDEFDAGEDAAGDDVTEEDTTEEDTEVLGVQLTRDDPEPGGIPAWLIAAGVVLLGLVGYGAFRLRHAIR